MSQPKHGLFSVRTRLLAAIAKWAYPSDDRPHLARVLFDGKHVVAVDGHRMVVVPLETGVAPFLIDRVDIAALAAAQREITKYRTAELTFASVDGGLATVELDGSVTSRLFVVRTYDAKDFPPWETLITGAKAETPAPPAYAFEPRYLAGIDEVIEARDGDVQRTVAVTGWTGNDPGSGIPPGPMLFESFGESGMARFLIMPKRS